MARTALLPLCLLLASTAAQSPGSNPGLPPSATATGLAPQKLTDMTVREMQRMFSYTDKDLLQCLEAQFDSWAAFGQGMDPTLFGGGPPNIGGRKANLSPDIQMWAEEVARDEIGHVRILREALGADAVPCPLLDLDKSFEKFLLEEIGATGDQGCTIFAATNGNLTNVMIAAGLAGSAGYQSAADRHILWLQRNEQVPEFGVTVAEFFDKMSALRQFYTGPVFIDQPLVFEGGINLVPTDGNGVTLARTPQQVLNILVGGSADGKGWFFPEGKRWGINGRITEPRPLSVPVPEELLKQANAPYTIVQSAGAVDPMSMPTPTGNATAMRLQQLSGL
ncbi:Desiccation-related PCC13-62 [Micractinium conductrix]|uniref:Desiccation-related PCC13-62 n=1 Tax=Micractinium conductrix TaxID=554055 RepID=A0A2P6VI09_9CHLO|nr:Desiccation-related PCC13-62 [Micractinium conductrix]|eukprot:PSC73697.1 Desiccation-related PCC13-62 [Micractinium conductrix]